MGVRVLVQRPCVPEAHGAIVAGGSQAVAVRAEREAGDDAVVSINRQRFLSGRNVQQPDGAVEAGQGEALAVRAEGHAVAAVGVALLRELLLAGGRVPDLNDAVLTSPG